MSIHPRHDLEPSLSAPIRFAIVACVAGGERVEFSFVRDRVEITDSALSKQMTRLEEEGLVEIHKGYAGKRPRTWLSITPLGSERYERHVAALKAMIADG